MKFAKNVFGAAAFAMSLAACGGGGSDSIVTNPAVVNTKSAIVHVNGVNIGNIEAQSVNEAILRLASTYTSAPNTYPEQYKSMLSDKGMQVQLVGNLVDLSQNKLPDVIFSVKLLQNGSFNVVQIR